MINKKQFYVRPIDTTFFGPPEAQSAGETHFATSLFPPPPRAFQGLVRTRLLQAASPTLNLNDKSRNARKTVASLVGESDQLPAGWQIEGPFPVCEDRDSRLTPWLPAPLFLRKGQKQEPLRAQFIELAEDDHALGGVLSAHNHGTPTSMAAQQNSVNGLPAVVGFDDSGSLGGWISASNMLWALSGKGKWDDSGHASLPPIVRREFRVGLAFESGIRRAMDHMLYSREDLRFGGRGGFMGTLTADLPSRLSADSLTTGTAAFGRSNRLAALEPVVRLDSAWEHIVNGQHLPAKPVSNRFWLVLLTPARFDSEFSKEGTSVLNPHPHGFSGSLTFVGALLGEPITLGGYSIAEHKARSNWRYVPAGSCWLFELERGKEHQCGEILRALNGSHCIGRRDEAAMGFGQVFVGIP